MAEKRSVSLVLECEEDELSSAQIKHKKQRQAVVADLFSALMTPANKETPLDGVCISQNSVSCSSLPISNGAQSIQQPTISTVPSNSVPESGCNSSAALNNSVPLVENTIQETPPIISENHVKERSLTSKLRATRKIREPRPIAIKPAPIATPSPTPEIVTVPNSPKTTLETDNSDIEIISEPHAVQENENWAEVLQSVKKEKLNTASLNIIIKTMTHTSVNPLNRKILDGKVKAVLVKPTNKFVEWLFTQGLITTQKYCSVPQHKNHRFDEMKLATFSDGKSENSGGYVWWSRCCQRTTSVYDKSLFIPIPLLGHAPPVSMLKLLYHWSCQTSIANIETWVKVSREVIFHFYTLVRAACSIILQDAVNIFGAESHIVEIGIVSLGTTTSDGAKKCVKVELLGIYDRVSKGFRLFASTPDLSNTAQERFQRILEPIDKVVHPNATILCDQTINKECFKQQFPRRVKVCVKSDDPDDLNTNFTIMNYLRKHVPKMFQSSLSQLTERQVQLMLDELCWRERYAASVLTCYESILKQLKFITQMEHKSLGVMDLLTHVVEHGNLAWRYNKSFTSSMVSQAQDLTVPQPFLLSDTAETAKESAAADPVSATYNPVNDANKSVSSKIGRQPRRPIGSQATVSTPNSPGTDSSSDRKSPDVSTIVDKSDSKVKVPQQMEMYFYGRLAADKSLGQESNICPFQCHICGDAFGMNNIKFFLHLKKHYAGFVSGANTGTIMCPYCVRTFPTDKELNAHISSFHYMYNASDLWCRICEERFRFENALKTHMARKHLEAEIPYRCQVCQFGSSIYQEVIDHFTRTHNGTAYVLCHLCLHVHYISPSEASSFSARLYQHLLDHSASRANCLECLLTFATPEDLLIHKKEHFSCAHLTFMSRYSSPRGYRQLTFVPTAANSVQSQMSRGESIPAKGIVAFSKLVSQNIYQTIKLPEANKSLNCVECKLNIAIHDHFKKKLKCNQCEYSTCCSKGILLHFDQKHINEKPIADARPFKLQREVIKCSCGFTTPFGNLFADHLVNCGKSQAIVEPVELLQSTMADYELELDEEEL